MVKVTKKRRQRKAANPTPVPGAKLALDWRNTRIDGNLTQGCDLARMKPLRIVLGNATPAFQSGLAQAPTRLHRKETWLFVFHKEGKKRAELPLFMIHTTHHVTS
jgi:hypothetical protein